MFNYIKFAMHFSLSPFGTLDPMVMELIRTERMMRYEEERNAALASQNDRGTLTAANENEAPKKEVDKAA